MRKQFEEIQLIANKLGCDEIYSWSKYNQYKGDTYTFFLRYILKIPEDRKDSIYGVFGNASHDILEKYYNKEISYTDMIEIFEEKLFEFTIGNLIQAYVDAIHMEKREDKDILVITDWKTSSIYKGKKILKEQGQLILYSYGVHKKLNIPMDQIVARWAFLKYVEVECMQANGKLKSRIIERNSIGSSLSSNAKMWLKKSDNKFSEEEIDDYLSQMLIDNSIDCLPDDVKSKFVVKDCYVEISLDDESIQELLDDIIKTVEEIKEKQIEYKNTLDNKIWWQDVTDTESYFLANLNGYSAKIHAPYKAYLESLDMFKNKENSNKVEEEDLTWLTELLD